MPGKKIVLLFFFLNIAPILYAVSWGIAIEQLSFSRRIENDIPDVKDHEEFGKGGII